MPEFHAEPYVYLAGLSHKTALIAWGAFYFKARSDGRAKLVDDQDLQWVHPPRCESIGCRSAPYGPARVEIRDAAGALVAEALTNTCNHCAISGLSPNTRYTYTVTVKHEVWGQGVRWDWDPQLQGLAQRDREYRNEFRTLPDPQAPLDEPFSFIVIGDFGTGIRKPSSGKRRQFEVAQALERAVDQYDARLVLTTGDNIYAAKRFLLWTGDSGDEDDDWFFTYFQPYRYVLNRIPWCPSIGNHDTRETEEHDDREQVMDNFYLRERLAGEEAAGRASVSPGLFYRFRVGSDVELVCFDTSKEDFFRRGRLFEYPKHWDFMQRAFPPVSDRRHPMADSLRTPSAVLRRSAARQHRSDGGGRAVVRGRGRARLLQRARAQLPALAAGTASTISSPGPAARSGASVPNRFAEAHTVTWSGECHFLLVTIDGSTMTVRAIGESRDGAIVEIPRLTPSGETVQGPMVVSSL